MELAGIASVLPYVNLVMNPAGLEKLSWFGPFKETLNLQSTDDILLYAGMLCLLLFVCGTSLKILTQYSILKYSYGRNYAISVRLLERYFKTDFEDFCSRHSSDYVKVILTEVTQVTSGILMPLLNLISHGLVVLLIVAFLAFTNPKAAVLVLGSLPVGYLVTYFLIRKKLVQLGVNRDEFNGLRYSSLSEAVNGIRDLKLGEKQGIFLSRFEQASRGFNESVAISQAIVQLPKFVLELIIFGGMLIGILVLLKDPQYLNDYLPLIAVYAFAGYRLLPSAQMLYSIFSNLKFSLPALENLFEDLRVASDLDSYYLSRKSEDSELTFEKAIEFVGVNFKYKLNDIATLRDINLSIPKGAIVGVVGKTGSGKSTFIDILLGLVKPTRGHVLVDGCELSDVNISGWHSKISYVPQSIYLVDGSVQDNVAFGVPYDEVDIEKVSAACKAAALADFIDVETPEGLSTQIGERGVRISGGQRQRLGIARALYNRGELIILDEATSALDSDTEAIVMRSILNAFKDQTVIMIAHRVSTLSSCDLILEIKDGAVAFIGAELLSGRANN